MHECVRWISELLSASRPASHNGPKREIRTGPFKQFDDVLVSHLFEILIPDADGVEGRWSA